MGGSYSTYEEERYIQDLVVKFGGNRSLGKPRHRWEDNIKMYLQGIVWVCGLY
jgi:hypothetical protein